MKLRNEARLTKKVRGPKGTARVVLTVSLLMLNSKLDGSNAETGISIPNGSSEKDGNDRMSSPKRIRVTGVTPAVIST